MAADIVGDAAVRATEEDDARRIPILEGRDPVGIISIADLAMDRNRWAASGEISAAGSRS